MFCLDRVQEWSEEQEQRERERESEREKQERQATLGPRLTL